MTLTFGALLVEAGACCEVGCDFEAVVAVVVVVFAASGANVSVYSFECCETSFASPKCVRTSFVGLRIKNKLGV